MAGKRHGLGRLWPSAARLAARAACRVPTAVLVPAAVLVPTAVLVSGAASITAAAAAPAGLVITAFSDAGSYIGNGVPQEFDPTNASFGGTATATGINLSATGGTEGSSWTFAVNPPPGAGFHVGYYPKVQMAGIGSQAWGYAGLNIGNSSAGCGGRITGWIEVRDLAVSGSAITRLDLLYEQHCDGGLYAVFGEIRMGEPQTSGLIVSSSSITWPLIPGMGTGSHGETVPVYIRNATAAPVPAGRVAVQGQAAADFSLANDTCSGATLAPGASCGVDVSFAASTRGARSAALRLPLGTRTYGVQLDAVVRPGTTSLTLHSQPGDPVGQGNNYSFTGADASFGDSGSSLSGFSGGATPTSGAPWSVAMFAAPGDILAAGSTYRNVTYYVPLTAGNGLAVSDTTYVPCKTITGSFTVRQAVFSPVDNSLQNFDGTFTQYCDGASGALTGEFKYDAEPVTVAPGVSNLTAVATGTGLDITWANPASSGYRYTLVRIVPSASPAGVAPHAGSAVYAGAGTSAVAHGLTGGRTYTVVAYTVDQYGNASYPAEYRIAL